MNEQHAFPVYGSNDPGMSYRQWLIGHVIDGLCSNANFKSDMKLLISRAAQITDALIEEGEVKKVSEGKFGHLLKRKDE